MPPRGFRQRARRALRDSHLQEALHRATVQFETRRAGALATLEDSEVLRRRAWSIRDATLRRLEEHLKLLCEHIEKAGGEVHFAREAKDVHSVILEIARRRGRPLIAKSKSMATEEVHLNEALERAGLRPVETDLGEWILQLAGERPSHLIAPAIHKTTEDIARVLSRTLGEDLPPESQALTAAARRALRETFLSAGIGITGVNFAVAETGSLILVTNEGNGRMVTSLPPVHVALMGVEKVVPKVEDAVLLLLLLGRSGTGQKMTSYVSLLTGPRRPSGGEGPEEFHLILLDNGRVRHLGGPFQEALQCIRCGACLNACPVYQKVGGHTYDSVYSGPIGSILTPMLQGLHEGGELAFASSLCGACYDACPVRIDIPRMLLEMRRAAVESRETSWLERCLFQTGGWVLRHHLAYVALGRAAWTLMRPFVRDGHVRWLPWPFSRFTRRRLFPALAKRPFRARWKEMKGSHQSVMKQEKESAPEEAWLQRISRTLERGFHHAVRPIPRQIIPRPEDPVEAMKAELEALSAKAYVVPGLREAAGALRAVLAETRAEVLASWDTPLLRELHEAYQALPQAEARPLLWLWGAGRERDFEALKGAQLGLTEADFAVSDSGTLGLVAGPGRSRLVSLLPPAHLALLPAERILPSLPHAVPSLLGSIGRDRAQAIDLITGPSRSSDIELKPALGVHGPGAVHVIILKAPP